MPSQQNITKVEKLSELIENSKSVVLADYTGLSVNDQRKLRQSISDSGGKFIVAKNTLFKLALRKLKKGLPRELEESLRGPTAFLFVIEDEIAPIKAMIQYSEEHELPKTKIGVMLDSRDRILSIEEIEALAKLPTKDQLVSQLISTLTAPRNRFVTVLSGNLQKLTIILLSIKKQKEVN